MKKGISKIILAILSFAIMLSASGCTLFLGDGFSGFGPGGDDLPPVVSNYTVEFGTINEQERSYDRLAAINRVKRANVAIIVSTSAGAAYGSGVIVDIDLHDENEQKLDSENEFYILTCHHVIASGGDIVVCVPDKNSRNFTDDDYDESFMFEGVIDNRIHSNNAVTLVGGDPFTDIAVLKLDLSGTSVSKDDIVEVKMPSSDYTHSYGEEVFAIGNPGGTMPMSVSDGIISYLERTMIFDSTKLTVMQITAHATHGNSGGGVYNHYGELIGLVNGGSDVYLTRNAIPFKNLYSDEDTGLMYIAEQLIKSKTSANYGYLPGRWSFGITTEEIKSGSNYMFSIKSVSAGSNASKSGLKQGDIITSVTYFDGERTVIAPITTESSFMVVVAELKYNYKVGGSFKISVKRSTALGNFDTDVTFTITEQLIFCDTGVYPEEN